MGAVFKHRGSFKNIERFLKGYNTEKITNILERHGQEGVKALALATPINSGLTANSWGYIVHVSRNSFSITFTNNNLTDSGTPIAILIQYGHGTKNGGYIQGRNFINPAIQPIFDKITDSVWREVKNL